MYLTTDLQEQFQEAQDKQVCISCGGDASEFRSYICKSEYNISGLCQKCQDEVFE